MTFLCAAQYSVGQYYDYSYGDYSADDEGAGDGGSDEGGFEAALDYSPLFVGGSYGKQSFTCTLFSSVLNVQDRGFFTIWSKGRLYSKA